MRRILRRGRFGDRAFRSVLAMLIVAAIAPAGCDGDTDAQDAGKAKAPAAETSGAGESSGGNAGGWKDILVDVAGQIALGAEGGILFYAYDTLAWPEQSVELLAKVASLKGVKGVAGATVTFTLDDKRLGSARTDSGGQAKLEWTPPREGSFIIDVRLTKLPDGTVPEVLPTSLMVLARAKDARFIVVDLDHTVVDSGFARVLMGMAKPMAGAAETLRQLQREGYDLIYLTHRPDLMTAKSKNWLVRNDFPRSPLLVSTLEEALGDSGKFKTGRIKALREKFPNVSVGIGDKFSDAEAYVANGMKAYLIPHYKRDSDDAEDFEEVAEKVDRLSGSIQVVDSWEQVKAGLTGGQRYGPKDYTDRLKAKAAALRRQERLRRLRDDDDD